MNVLRQSGYGTGFGSKAFLGGGGASEASMALAANNIRVRLQDKDDEEDLSDAENDNELMMDAHERNKIKLENQKR